MTQNPDIITPTIVQFYGSCYLSYEFGAMINLTNKRIVLMGLGSFEKGSGISAAKFLIGRCKELTITDLKTKRELAKPVKEIIQLSNKLISAKGGSAYCGNKSTTIVWRLGGHLESDFETADVIVRNPDVPPSNKYLAIARKRGIPIHNDITLFFSEYGVRDVIGVTGTRGKSTTATLIYEMVRRQFSEARLGGNIGESPLGFLTNNRQLTTDNNETMKQWNNETPIVLELSNFQLADLDTIKMSPHIAVWTNLYPDHLNKYKSIKDYIKDKMKILEYQKIGDVAVLNWDNPATRRIGLKCQNPNDKCQINSPRADKIPNPKFKILWFSLKNHGIKDGAFVENGWFVFVDRGKKTRVCRISETRLLGVHNQANILAAICAARGYGVGWQAIRAAIREFKGVPNRLEIVSLEHCNTATLKHVTFVNDCTATSPDATIAALKSFPKKKIILISGGNSKGSPIKEMSREIARSAKAVVLMPGNATGELERLIRRGVETRCIASLRQAVTAAVKMADAGDIILLSPGLTWLPRQNEFERGEEFVSIVKSLITKKQPSASRRARVALVNGPDGN